MESSSADPADTTELAGGVAADAGAVTSAPSPAGEVPDFKPDRRITILQSQDDAPWVEAAKQSAFAEIVDEFEGPLTGFVTKMLGSATAAEDVVQEAFLRAYRNIGDFEQIHPNGFSQWLYLITRRLALNASRNKKTDMVAQSMVSTPATGPDPLPTASHPSRIGIPGERMETRETLGILNMLSPIHRSLLVMSMEGLSLEQMAEAEGISVAAVKSRIWRGREAAGRILERMDKVPKLALTAEARQAMDDGDDDPRLRAVSDPAEAPAFEYQAA